MEMIPNVVYRFISIISCIVFANFTDIVGGEQGKGRQGERREGRDKGEKRREKGEGERKKGERREVKGKRREGERERREGEGGRREKGTCTPLSTPSYRMSTSCSSDLTFVWGICVLWTHSFLTLYHI